jgi:hypothetical protein
VSSLDIAARRCSELDERCADIAASRSLLRLIPEAESKLAATGWPRIALCGRLAEGLTGLFVMVDDCYNNGDCEFVSVSRVLKIGQGFTFTDKPEVRSATVACNCQRTPFRTLNAEL